jgi:hypothetical protein
VPPKGFNLVPLNDKTVSKTAGLFDNLQGKEVWHITAPAGVSLKDLSKMDMDKAMGGEAVLSYKGADYGLVKTEKSEDGTRDIFVPRKNGMDPGMLAMTTRVIVADSLSCCTDIAYFAPTNCGATPSIEL